MLSENDIKEELSYAYVHAVAARASFACERISKDRDSVDVTIRAKGKLVAESKLFSPTLDLQLKATSRASYHDEHLVFDLPVKNYNELRERYPSPRLLIVLVLPEDQQEWVSYTGKELVTRRCAYWFSLSGMLDVGNSNTRRVMIPKRQLFSPEKLHELMVVASLEQEIRNDEL